MKSAAISLLSVLLVSLSFLSGCRRSDSPDSGAADRASALLARGQESLAAGQVDSAIIYYNKALAVEGVPDSIACCALGELSAAYQMAGDMRRSLDYGKKAMLVGKDIFVDEDFATLAGNIGVTYRRLGMNDSAAIFYRRGLDRMLGKTGNEDVTAYLYNNLSVLYCEMLRYDEALGFAREAAKFARQADDEVEYLSALSNEGVILVKMDSLENGMRCLKTVFERAESTGSRPLVLKTANYLAFAAHALGDEQARLRYINAGIEASADYPPESAAVQGMVEAKANYLYDHGDYAGALRLASKLDSLAPRQLVIPSYKLKRFQSMCLSALGRPGEALALERKATAIQDSIASAEVEAQLSEYSVRLKTQETKIALLMAESKAAENAVVKWIFIAAFFVVTAVLIVWIVIVRARRRKEEQKREIERSARYIEGLEAERVRMANELHDGVCNDLLGVCYLLQLPEIDRATVLDRVSSLRTGLRRIAHDRMPPEFRYADINEILADYVDNLSAPEGVKVSYASSGTDWSAVAPAVAYQFYRIAQEAVSNALRHSKGAEITVSLTLGDNGSLIMTVKDSGGNLATDSIPDGAAGGIGSMRERARGIGADFSISAENGFTTVTVSYGKP